MLLVADLSLRGKSVVVTGGAGFIGSHVVDRILEEGPRRLEVIDNLWLGKRANLAGPLRAGVRLHVADAGKTHVVRDIVRRAKADVVFALATIPLPASLVRPKWSYEQIVDLALVVAELARLGEYGTLIYCSSSEVYGSAVSIPMRETHPLNAETPYAAAKASGDLIVRSYWRTFGIDAAIVRPFNTYGPRQNAGDYAGIIPLTLRRIRDDAAPVIQGDGRQTRDFLFVTDTADAIVRAYAASGSRGQVVNVASGIEVSIKDVVSEIARLTRYRGPVEWLPARAGDVRRHRGDAGLAKELLGFRPRVGIRAGLRRTVAWYSGVAPGRDRAS